MTTTGFQRRQRADAFGDQPLNFLGQDQYGATTDVSAAKRVPLRVLFDSADAKDHPPAVPTSPCPGTSQQQSFKHATERCVDVFDFGGSDEEGHRRESGAFSGVPVYDPNRARVSFGDKQSKGALSRCLTFESPRTWSSFGEKQQSKTFGGGPPYDPNRRLTFEPGGTPRSFEGKQQSGTFGEGPPYDPYRRHAFEPTGTPSNFGENGRNGTFGGGSQLNPSRSPPTFASKTRGGGGAFEVVEPGFQKYSGSRDMQMVDNAQLVLRKGYRPIVGRKYDHAGSSNCQSTYVGGKQSLRVGESDPEKAKLSDFGILSVLPPPPDRIGGNTVMPQDQSFSSPANRDSRPLGGTGVDEAGGYGTIGFGFRSQFSGGNRDLARSGESAPLACGGYHGTKASAYRCLTVNVDEARPTMAEPSFGRMGQDPEAPLFGGCAGLLNVDGSFDFAIFDFLFF